MRDVTIEEGAVVEYSIIDSNVSIGKDAKVGAPKDNADGIAVVGGDLEIPEGMKVAGGLMVNQSKLEELLAAKEEN
jgi:ADP-glucose pyrophosphorylase